MRGIFLVLSVLMINSVSVRAEMLDSVPEVCQAEFLENEKKINPSEYENMSFTSIDPKHPDTIVFGGKVTRHFLTVLDQLPLHIHRIALEIPQGGDALASFLIADKVRKMGLDTYVGLAPCVSACTVIFQAGHERIAHPKATYFNPMLK